MSYLKQVVVAASGISEGEYVQPSIFLVSGDIEIGIFAPAMGEYQLVVAGHELTCLRDESFDSLPAALIAATRFLLVEYGLENAAALLAHPDALTQA